MTRAVFPQHGISKEAVTKAGNRIRQRRLDLSIPLERLATQSGMPIRLLNLFEHGLHSPTDEHLHSVAHWLGTTAANLLRP